MQEFQQDKDNITLFYSTEKLGFIHSQIFYVEEDYNKLFYHFINQNFDKIAGAFDKAGFDFIYFPRIIDDFPILHSEWLWKVINYCKELGIYEIFFRDTV